MHVRILAAVTLLLLGTARLQATPITTIPITVDENGNGSIGPHALQGSLITRNDHHVLAYPLPGLVVPGDVVLREPNRDGASDLIRFVDVVDVAGTVSTHSLLLFYSDPASPGETPDLADVGVPTEYLPLAKTFDETGLFGHPYSENGPNGLVYTPTANDPGFFVDATTNLGASYTFVSDTAAVPLPASAGAGLVLVAGLAAWKAYQHRRSGAGSAV